MGKLDGLRRVTVGSRAQWRAWLEANHTLTESIWLISHKKIAGSKYLPYDAIVEEALCFGWIDSLPRKLDEDRKMLLLSPRKPKSVWSKLNKERVARLIEAGLMHPAGLAKVERAKQDGSWDRLNDSDALIIPADLQAAFRKKPGSRTAFNALSPSLRRGLLAFLNDAKTPATREKRIAQICETASSRAAAIE